MTQAVGISQVTWARLVACLLLAACSSPRSAEQSPPANEDDVLACAKNEDCPDSMICSPSLELATAPPKRIQMTAPPPPCPFIACIESAQCSEGQLCVSAAQALGPSGFIADCPATVCGRACVDDNSCAADQVCRDSGLCEILGCNEDSGPSCPQNFVCDPQDPSAQPNGCRVIRCDEPDGRACAVGSGCDPGATGSDALGCRVLRCDEPGAQDCSSRATTGGGQWVCDPGSATDVTGCAPVPCSASDGGCQSDLYVCTPTSDAGRSAGTDAFGCVRRNCEEGLECHAPLYMTDASGQTVGDPIEIGYCDFEGPFATLDGCAQRHCTELEVGCTTGQACEPDHPDADRRGCRALRCDEVGGPSCGTTVCESGHPRASWLGCRPLLCEDLPDFQCPPDTECNSRGSHANSMGCAPPGDAEPVSPTPATTPSADPNLPVAEPPSAEPPSAEPANSGPPDAGDGSVVTTPSSSSAAQTPASTETGTASMGTCVSGS